MDLPPPTGPAPQSSGRGRAVRDPTKASGARESLPCPRLKGLRKKHSRGQADSPEDHQGHSAGRFRTEAFRKAGKKNLQQALYRNTSAL